MKQDMSWSSRNYMRLERTKCTMYNIHDDLKSEFQNWFEYQNDRDFEQIWHHFLVLAIELSLAEFYDTQHTTILQVLRCSLCDLFC